MLYFRYVLLAVNFAGALVALLAVRSFNSDDAVAVLALGAIFTLNFIYLLQPAGPGRLGRMASLWLDAKEADLKSRATAAGSPHNATSDESRRTN